MVMRTDSRVHQFRKRTPLAVLQRARGRRLAFTLPGVGKADPMFVDTLVGAEIKFSLLTTDDEVAGFRRAAAATELERFFNAIESPPVRPSKADLVRISGLVYHLYWETYGDDPGDPDVWASWKAMTRASLEGRISEAVAVRVGDAGDGEEAFARFGGDDLTTGINALPRSESTEALEKRFGGLASWVCGREGIEVEPATRAALLREIGLAAKDVGWRLKRASQSDYSPDPKEARFPPAKKVAAVSLREVLDRWVTETKPSHSTKTNWRAVVGRVEKELGAKAGDIRRIGPDELIHLKDALLASGLAPKTVRDTHFAALKRLLRFAKTNLIITVNPADDIDIAVKVAAGTTRKPYEDNDVARLLDMASLRREAHVRFVLPIVATTGARLSEITALHRNQVLERDGFHVLNIRPSDDGATLKNEASERLVPLHDAVLATGFIDWAKARPEGPLFYGTTPKEGKRHPSRSVTGAVSKIIRKSGFTDPRVDPAHGLRHWARSQMANANVQNNVADRVVGHRPPGEGERYKHLKLQTLAAAIATIKIPALPAPKPETETDEKAH